MIKLTKRIEETRLKLVEAYDGYGKGLNEEHMLKISIELDLLILQYVEQEEKDKLIKKLWGSVE